MIEKLVDAELAAVSVGEQPRRSQATYSWSMTRQTGARTFSVDANGAESSIVAGDLRFEILTDPIHYELTRGVTVTIHQYDVMESADSVARARLRREVTSTIHRAVIDNCYRLPS